MYKKIFTKRFEKSLKKVMHSGKIKRVEIETAVEILASGKTLPLKYKDHSLHGSMHNLRECHIKGDLLLVYQIRKRELVLILIDIGNHSELF
ncbi:MAG: type II toxin-antitoxin system YafQ family toxin [Minisyncoccia bacterium]